MLQPGTYLYNQRYRVLQLLGKGGFGETYRVDDDGQTKVLKLLTSDYHKAINLFKREARVLSRLHHFGIPKIGPNDGYIEISGAEIGQKGTMYCLIMEEVKGANLSEFMNGRNRKPLEHSEARDWLKQITEILKIIHSENIIHRDIKPSNIMLRPNGQLVLIDFGIARECTDTFLDRRAQDLTTTTKAQSPDYASPEQRLHRANLPTDFYSLGLTFIYLATGRSHLSFCQNEKTSHFLWRDHAPQISPKLADLLDWMMEYSEGNRPQNADEILKAIAEIESFESGQTKIEPRIPTPGHRANSLTTLSPPTHLGTDSFRKPAIHLLGGLLVAIILMGLRSAGLLRPLEFAAFDQLMRWRPTEPPDDRLLIIEIDQASLAFQEDLPGQNQGSLADVALNQTLNQLLPHQPRAIGLDIYRDFTVDPNLPELKQQMQTTPLFAMCFSGDGNQPAITPPPEIPLDRIGFSDFAIDPDDTIRRQLVGAGNTEDCTPEESLNFQLAMAYLEAEGFSYDASSSQLEITNHRDRTDLWPRITGDEGLYTANEALGFTVLLNYRATGNGEVAQRISLQDLLSGKLDDQLPDLVKDRVILIGNTIPIAQAGVGALLIQGMNQWLNPWKARSEFRRVIHLPSNVGVGGDYHHTPYGALPGVVIHGHMISQMLSTAQDQRPILRLGQEWGNLLWILGWTILGSSLALTRERFLRFLALNAIAFGSLVGLSWLLLLNGLWLPLAYPLLGVGGPTALVILLKAAKSLRREEVMTSTLDASSKVDLQRSLKPIKQLKNG